MKKEITQILETWLDTFCHEKGLAEVEDHIFKENKQVCTVPLDATILAYVSGFAEKTTKNKRGKLYCLRQIHDNVEEYLRVFDVRPMGPDMLKYFWALGMGVYEHAQKSGEKQPLILAAIRVNIVRTMVAVAKAQRELSSTTREANSTKLTNLLVNKLLLAWEQDKSKDMYGNFGTYSVIKMMAVS